MKKILFGTSAIIAASLFSGAAFAADGMSLSMSGSVTSGLGVEQTNTAGVKTDSHRIVNDGEIAFKGKTTLDNGLTFGVKTEVTLWGPGTGRTAKVDESMVYVEGAFGRLEIGEEDGAHDQMLNVGASGAGCVWQCAYDGGGFVLDRTANYGIFDPSIDGNDTSDDLKITYYTPSFSGLKAGVSYIPNEGSQGTNLSGAANNQAAEAGLSYAGSFGDVSLGLGAGVTYRQKDNYSWAVGGTVGMSGFSLGLAYEDGKTSEDRGFGVGLGYATGPWGVGVSYGNGNDNDTWGVGAGVSYKLGAGVDTGVSIEYARAKTADIKRLGGAVWLGLSF